MDARSDILARVTASMKADGHLLSHALVTGHDAAASYCFSILKEVKPDLYPLVIHTHRVLPSLFGDG